MRDRTELKRVVDLERQEAELRRTAKQIAAQRDRADERAQEYLEILDALFGGLLLLYEGARRQEKEAIERDRKRAVESIIKNVKAES